MNTAAPKTSLGMAPTWIAAFGVLVLFIGVRVGDDNLVFPIAGLVFVLAGLLMRAVDRSTASGGARLLLTQAVLAHLAIVVGGAGVVATTVKVVVDDDAGNALLSLGVLLVMGGTALIFALEMLMQQTRITGVVETARLQRATTTTLTVVAGLAMLVAFVYGLQRQDKRFEFAWNAPTSPSGATLALLDTAACGDAKEKPEIFLFFERGSTAVSEVADYFAVLSEKGARVQVLDQAMDPALAKAIKVTKNGYVGLRCGGKTESWLLGAERDDAQKKLAKLDEEIRNRLGKITRDPVNVYMTVGHGERPVDESDKTGRAGGKSLKKLLEAQNVKTKKFGIGDGLTAEVPKDAAVVVGFGPQQPFLPEETRTLVQYVLGGGAVAVFLDPPLLGSVEASADVTASLQPLLDALSLKAGGAELVNEKEYVKQANAVSDHVFIFATSFGSHKAIKTLNGARSKAAVLFQSAQSIAKVEAKEGKEAAVDGAAKVSMIARTRPATWSDVVKNRSFDEGSEKRDIYDFAAVVEMGDARALVVGDSDVVGDILLNNEANAVFAYEAFAWLLRDDRDAPAAVTVSDDAPIRHTRDEDTVWFYGTVLGAPLLVLVTGLLSLQLRKQRRAAAKMKNMKTEGGAA